MCNLRSPWFMLAVALCCNVHAQYPVVATGNTSLTTVFTLSSGVKYMDFFLSNTTGAGSRTLYDADMTVFRVLNYPAPPPDMNWSGTMRYITASLFDTDPSTVEFVMTAVPASGPGNFATFVFREDGTQLFAQDPGNLAGSEGTFMGEGSPIFTTPDGTYMMIHTNMVLGPPVNIYELPGSLPCMDCFGTPQADAIGTGDGMTAEPFSGMSIMPNPVQADLRIQFSERGLGTERIVVLDATGREVLSMATTRSATLDLDVRGLANGRYTVMSMAGTTLLGALPFIIAR